MPPPIATSTIAQQAFRLMELSPPSSYDDGSEKALAAAEQYPVALRMVLERADWSFASTWAELPAASLPEGVAADPGMPHFYALPGDIVLLREVGTGCTRWRRDRAGLRADTKAPLPVRYTGMIEAETLLPALVQTATALQLAVLLGPRWLVTQSKMDTLRRDLQIAVQGALRADAAQASPGRYDGLGDQPDWVDEATGWAAGGAWR